MEANENNEPKKESSPSEQNIPKEKTQQSSDNKNMNIYDQYKAEKENHQETTKKPEVQNNSCPNPNVNNSNPSEKESSSQEGEGGDAPPPQQKTKRRRRGKSEINDRKYSCPDCDKCYLSGPALTTHRKNKHGYGESEKNEKKRGRPKKEEHGEGNQNFQAKYSTFFEVEHRKRNVDNLINNNEEGKNEEEKEVELSKIKNNLIKLFNFYKENIFKDIDNIEKYSFYNLIVENWERPKDNIFPKEEKFCYSTSNNKNELPQKINTYNIDQLFFLYLKEFSKKVNDDYLWFMIKFIVLFRDCINSERKSLIKQEHMTDKRMLYTQIYSAETVPEICNSFYLSYLQPNEFYGLNQEELIELIQHFCNWLNVNNYTCSKLTLL